MKPTAILALYIFSQEVYPRIIICGMSHDIC